MLPAVARFYSVRRDTLCTNAFYKDKILFADARLGKPMTYAKANNNCGRWHPRVLRYIKSNVFYLKIELIKETFNLFTSRSWQIVFVYSLTTFTRINISVLTKLASIKQEQLVRGQIFSDATVNTGNNDVTYCQRHLLVGNRPIKHYKIT